MSSSCSAHYAGKNGKDNSPKPSSFHTWLGPASQAVMRVLHLSDPLQLSKHNQGLRQGAGAILLTQYKQHEMDAINSADCNVASQSI